MIFKQREIKKRSYRGRFLFSFIARGYRMKYYMLLLLLMSLFVNSYAQEEGEDMPPIPPMPGQQAQKKPLDILKEVQKKMEEIGQSLSKGTVDKASVNEKKIQEAIERVANAKEEEKQIIYRLSKMLSSSGEKQSEVQKDLEKLLEEKNLDALKKKLKALEDLQQAQQKQEEAQKALEELSRCREHQKKAIEELEKLMQECGAKQGDVEKELQKLFEEIQKQKKASDAIEKMLEDIKKQQKTIKEMDRLFNQLENKQGQVIKDIDEIVRMAKQYQSQQKMPSSEGEKPKDQGKDKDKDKQDKESDKDKEKDKGKESDKDKDKGKDKDKKNPPEDDNERWGDLPPRVREYINAIRNMKLPGKYQDEILEYYRRMAEVKEKDK